MEKEEYIKQLRYEKWIPLLKDLQTYKRQVLAEKYTGAFSKHMVEVITEEVEGFIMWAMSREAMSIRDKL